MCGTTSHILVRINYVDMRFYLERTARAIFTVWVAITLTFGIIRFMPSGPIEQITGQLIRAHPSWSQERIQQAVTARVESLNLYLDEPLYVQYYKYMEALLQGNLGQSISESSSVAEIVASSLPWTAFVMTTATIIVFILGILIGAIIAYKEGTLLDSVVSTGGVLTAAIPFYVLGFALILVFGHQLGWLPTGGKKPQLMRVALTPEFVVGVITHAILPIASVVITQVGLQALAMRGNSVQVLGEDYVRVARLRGLSDRRIATRYVGRNAILPMYTGFLTLIGFNLGGSIILEQVFNYRGMGFYMFMALENRDYPLMMGVFLVFTVALVLAVYIADLTYSWVDPRIKQGGASEAY